MDIEKIVFEIYGATKELAAMVDKNELMISKLADAIKEVSDTSTKNFEKINDTITEVMLDVEASKVKVDTALDTIKSLLEGGIVVNTEITNVVESEGNQGDITQNVGVSESN